MKKLLALGLAVGVLTLSAGATAQTAATAYPQQPVRWIVPYAAGGATDTMARTLADVMQAGLGQPVVIDNRPGAATNIGVQALMTAKPDGYTVMNAENATLFFNEHMFAKLPYNPEKDFTYIGAIGRLPVVLTVGADFPGRTLAEFIAYARARPDQVTFASPGIGTSHHMAGELLKQKADIKITHVAYKGGALAVQDVVAGRVQAMFVDLTVAQQFIKSGKLRPLAVSSTQRIAALPDVPTFVETGLKDMVVYTVQGLVGPAGMPPATVDRLNAELHKALRTPRFTTLLADTGFEPMPGTPAEFRTLARAESARWGKLIKDTGVRLD